MAQELIRVLLSEQLEESERRESHQQLRRSLRDRSNPFTIPAETFNKLYRLNQETAMLLINALKPHVAVGRTVRAIPLELKVLVALNFYGQGSYQKAVGQDMNMPMSQPSVSRCISEVSSLIVTHLAREWIKFPKSREEVTNAQVIFFRRFGFPGVIGCVDGSHVALKAPSEEDKRISYFNRKGFYSINCQVVCGADLEIISINAQFPGSVHDSAIWTTSDVRAHSRSTNAPGVWLLGDSGYPLEPWLMTPHEAPVSQSQRKYNEIHILTRNCVERCLGVLKARFRCLLKQRELIYTHHVAINIIYACSILHNVCIKNVITMPEDEHQSNTDSTDTSENDSTHGDEGLTVARQIREGIIQRFFNL